MLKVPLLPVSDDWSRLVAVGPSARLGPGESGRSLLSWHFRRTLVGVQTDCTGRNGRARARVLSRSPATTTVLNTRSRRQLNGADVVGVWVRQTRLSWARSRGVSDELSRPAGDLMVSVSMVPVLVGWRCLVLALPLPCVRGRGLPVAVFGQPDLAQMRLALGMATSRGWLLC